MGFIKRNIPILVMGVILGGVFLIIIFIGQSNKSGISLKETLLTTFSAPKEEIKTPPPEIEVEETTPTPMYMIDGIPTANAGEVKETPETTQSDSIYPILNITFTEDGFKPISSNARTGQTVRWTNKTDRNILIKELIPMYKEFSRGVTLKPSESYELLLNRYKIWTFKEAGSGAIGKLVILKGIL